MGRKPTGEKEAVKCCKTETLSRKKKFSRKKIERYATEAKGT